MRRCLSSTVRRCASVGCAVNTSSSEARSSSACSAGRGTVAERPRSVSTSDPGWAVSSRACCLRRRTRWCCSARFTSWK
nr:hypothetical protein [Deltaproteobacteria bacterium]